MSSSENRFFNRNHDEPVRKLVPVTVKIDQELAERIKAMKALVKQKTGGYFSITNIVELAIEAALVQANNELNAAEEDEDDTTSFGDDLTML